MIQFPQSFVVGTECRKAAFQNGFRRDLGAMDGWARYASTTAKGSIYLAAATDAGPWYLALDHAGVVGELGLPRKELAGPGIARYVFITLGELYGILPRVYALGVALPDGPLEAFEDATKGMPLTTEAERLAVQRIGQGIFRDRLMTYWEGRCPLTDISDAALLRASHIKPWAQCETDAARLDVHNGLLLSALWDAAFDEGLVTFTDDGYPRFSLRLTEAARSALGWKAPLPLTDLHREYLAFHRQYEFISAPFKA